MSEHDTDPKSAGSALVKLVIDSAVRGIGPIQGGGQVADEYLRHHEDREVAIDRLIASHRRIVGAGGFLSGFGGFATMAVAVPADLANFYVMSGRSVAGIAHLRGYDLDSEEVRSMVLLSLLGAAGTSLASEVGVKLGTKAAEQALRRIPGRVLIDINKKVGFRLVTKAGQKGVFNLVKAVPVVGAGAGATLNLVGYNEIAQHAKRNFPASHLAP